jgi:aminopeptidase N
MGAMENKSLNIFNSRCAHLAQIVQYSTCEKNVAACLGRVLLASNVC